MTEYVFPLRSASALAERLEQPATGARVRCWVLRDDNQRHYHGRLELRDDPILLELRWKPNARGREQLVGLYRLHLSALLSAGYVRRERDDPSSSEVRLRFYRSERGVVVIQTNLDGPALPIGTVDRSLG